MELVGHRLLPQGLPRQVQVGGGLPVKGQSAPGIKGLVEAAGVRAKLMEPG